MSHDADKLIRQLSLVAFLMAERRPLTARDVKGNVEGYSEMSDEAFARRFYSDRAELTALGVPLTSQRDEFTGEELYTLRSENYFLDQLELDEDELAALQTALYALEGKFAYAEPLRLALQNLALGRPGLPPRADRDRRAGPRHGARLLARARRAALEARVGDLEAAHDPVPLLVAGARARDRATAEPVRASARRGRLVRRRPRPRPRRDPNVPRRADPLRHPVRDTARAGLPPAGRLRRRGAPRSPRPWQIGPQAGVARIGVQGDTAWWVHRTLADAGAVVDGVFETAYATLGPLVVVDPPPERQGRAARAGRSCATRCATALKLLRERHKGAAPETARERRAEARPPVERQPAGPVAPERFGVLQALLAHLLAACGDDRSAELDADELAERFSFPREELQETLSLLNLVNFGGGCYTVYAEVDEDASSVRVDKELYGDVFRKPPKLTPLEARAIRLAIEYVGPTIAAEADTPLERVRRKLEETFGQFELASPAATRRRRRRGGARPRALGRGREAAARRARVPEGGRGGADDAARRAVHDRAGAAVLARPHVGPDGRRAAHLSARPHALRAARRVTLRATRRLRSELPRRAGRRACSGTRRRSPAGSSSAAHGA